MKILRYLFTGLFVVVLTGCVSFSRIEENFEEAGYVYQSDASTWIDSTLQRFQDDDVDVQTHVFINGLDVAIVLEFDSRSDMRDQIENNESLQEWLSEDNNSDLIRGNFLLLPISFNSDTRDSMIEIFQQ